MRKGTKRKAREVGGRKGKSKEDEKVSSQEQTATTEEATNKNETAEAQSQSAAEQGESVQKEEPKNNDKGGEPSKGVVKRGAKRAKIAKPQTGTEYFPDKRNLVICYLPSFLWIILVVSF